MLSFLTDMHFIIGILVGVFGVPFVLNLLSRARSSATA